jgi:polysaccharide pyruvyl transferase CsaB
MSVVIAGYYGFENAGDELILVSLIRQIKRENPEERIVVFSNTPEETRNYFGVDAVRRWRPWAWAAPLLQADRFILGGGGLLQEDTGPWNHFYYLSLLVIAKLFGCRTEVVAIGVDPAKAAFNRFWTRFAFNHATDDASVRDEESRQALWDAGVRLPISIRPDPVSDLEIESGPEAPRGIALAVSSSKGFPDRSQAIARLCDRLAAHLQVSIDLLVFYPREDEGFARQVANQTDAIRRIRLWQNPLDLLAWIPQYQMVAATRFHALVISAAAKTPFMGWGDQKKVASFCLAHRRPYINTELDWDEDRLFDQMTGLYQSGMKSVILATRTD